MAERDEPISPVEVTEQTPAFADDSKDDAADEWSEVTPDEDAIDATDAWVEVESSEEKAQPLPSFEPAPSFIPQTPFEDAPSIEPKSVLDAEAPVKPVEPAPFDANVGSVVVDDLAPSLSGEAPLPPDRPEERLVAEPMAPPPELEAPRMYGSQTPREAHDIWGFSSEIDVSPPEPQVGSVVIDDVPIDDRHHSPRPSHEDATAMFAAELAPPVRPPVDDLLDGDAKTTTVASFAKQMQRAPKARGVSLNEPIRVDRRPQKRKSTAAPAPQRRAPAAPTGRHYPKMRALLRDPDAVPFGNRPPHEPAAPPVPGTFFPAAREPKPQPKPADLDGLLATMAEGLLIGETADGHTEIRVTLKDEFFAGTELRIVLGESGLVAELVPPDRDIYWQLSGNVDDLRERLTSRGLSVTEVKVSFP